MSETTTDETPDATAIERVVDQIILPAVAVGPTSHRTHEQKDS